MHILITGAAGMLGQRLARSLVTEGLGGRPVDHLTLVDVVPPARQVFDGSVTALSGDLSDPTLAERLIAPRPDVLFHLAAIVSGEAEVDLDKGYAVNLDGTRALFDAIRRQPGYCPRVVFASSLAVFGPPFPDRVPDDFAPTPRTSYGAQKLIGELLLSDLSRRGLMDGVALRLPTICIRPGKPNRAASGFFSGILREPLAGLPADLPVGEDVRHYFASPRAATGFFRHAATMDTAPLGHRRALVLPGISATVGDEIAALERAAGPGAVALIRRTRDPLVEGIVAGWPKDYEATRARDLGFVADASLDDIIAAHLADQAAGA